MYQLDKKDRQILQILQQDAKANIKAIAFQVGLSATPVYERIKRLEKKGIITHYAAKIDTDKIGLELLVFCQVSLQKHTKNHIADFENAVSGMPEVQEAYHIAGDFDYLLKILVHDSTQYHHFLVEKLSKLDMIANVQSNFVMFKTKESEYYPLQS